MHPGVPGGAFQLGEQPIDLHLGEMPGVRSMPDRLPLRSDPIAVSEGRERSEVPMGVRHQRDLHSAGDAVVTLNCGGN